jgi:hypothetical protein
MSYCLREEKSFDRDKKKRLFRLLPKRHSRPELAKKSNIFFRAKLSARKSRTAELEMLPASVRDFAIVLNGELFFLVFGLMVVFFDTMIFFCFF